MFLNHKNLFLLFLAASSAYALEIGLIDSERIFEELGDVKDARELLESEIEDYQLHADSLEADIKTIEEDLARTLMMSPERRREREALLRQKRSELEEFLSTTFGPGGIVEIRNEQLVTPIIAEINEVIREIGVEEDYDLIIDFSVGGVIYARESLDITDMVLDMLADVER